MRNVRHFGVLQPEGSDIPVPARRDSEKPRLLSERPSVNRGS